jgi:hypothetical protein
VAAPSGIASEARQRTPINNPNFFADIIFLLADLLGKSLRIHRWRGAHSFQCAPAEHGKFLTQANGSVIQKWEGDTCEQIATAGSLVSRSTQLQQGWLLG